MKYVKKLLGGVMVVLAGFLLVAITATSVAGLLVQNSKIPETFGNRSKNISFVERNTDPNDFTFAVVGDVKSGTATFEELLDIEGSDKPAFVIILGDFVNHSRLIDHKLFAYEMAEHAEKIPIFLVPGNHDVNEREGFGVKEFRAVYGSEQFNFTIGKNLFLCLNDIPPYSDSGQYISYMEQQIKEHLNSVERIFVFMHIPPSNLDSSIMSRALPGSKEFLNLIRKYHVDYVFAGDHHGYVKIQKDNTTFIVTGGGGAKLRGVHGRFHHLVRIAIENGSVTETVLGVKRYLETMELIERNIVIYLWPVIARRIIPVSIIFLLATGVVAVRFHRLFNK